MNSPYGPNCLRCHPWNAASRNPAWCHARPKGAAEEAGSKGDELSIMSPEFSDSCQKNTVSTLQAKHTMGWRKEQFHAVISPDESYLVIPHDTYYISFRDKNDNWTPLRKLDVVSKFKSGGCPSISSDGKYFFFSAYTETKWNRFFDRQQTYKDLQEILLSSPSAQKTDIYWVDARIIEKYRTAGLN